MSVESPEVSTTKPTTETATETLKPTQAQTNNHNEPVSSVGYLSVNLPSGLMVSYPQALASAFAFGQFSQKLKALDDAVAAYSKSLNEEKDS